MPYWVGSKIPAKNKYCTGGSVGDRFASQFLVVDICPHTSRMTAGLFIPHWESAFCEGDRGIFVTAPSPENSRNVSRDPLLERTLPGFTASPRKSGTGALPNGPLIPELVASWRRFVYCGGREKRGEIVSSDRREIPAEPVGEGAGTWGGRSGGRRGRDSG